jgi:RNA polymerase sigma factor for flagellar operon FliA
MAAIDVKRDGAALWAAYQRTRSIGDRNALVEDYLGLLRLVAGRCARSLDTRAELDDLIGWGAMGLIDAVEKFDPGRGVAFNTYATARIRGAILDGLRGIDPLPRLARQQARRYQSRRQRFIQARQRPPTDEEMADLCEPAAARRRRLAASDARRGKRGGRVRDPYVEMVRSARLAAGTLSLNRDARIGATIACPAPTPAQVAESADQRIGLLRRLPVKLRAIADGYWFAGRAQRQIADELGLSNSRVCQMLGQCLKIWRD